MTSTKKDPVIVVLQLTGGNDYFNTLIPYNDPLYYDNRPIVKYEREDIIKIDDTYGLMPSMGGIKELYDQGNVAIVNGVGYKDSPRSHFRSMDIWHTCEPDKVGTEGWAGRVAREMDPSKENVLTAINFGHGLPRALAVPGVPVAAIADLSTYGLLTGISDTSQRAKALDLFSRMYSPTVGGSFVTDYLRSTGIDAMVGADIVKVAPELYSSNVEYPNSPIAMHLRDIAQVYFADLGTRIFYTQHASFDTHAGEMAGHPMLWKDVSDGISAFFQDLKEHDAGDNVIMYLFSEFGRRVHDNGSGTDHGAAGASFFIGNQVKGGLYGEYPSAKSEDLEQGDLVPNWDFRSDYTAIVEDWLGMDASPIVNGKFEKMAILK
ncbi:MAG: DUF1501 domain-containing protein [Chloroflexi bacterium]|nr:DUF1501 domain-containing protein [Chloroflexota bacterium]MDA1218988.1 DUF1501 domain-containing protein [Chloroflexota bacterium]PKB57404.1 MAG: hypothetical protein BZY73_03410 [SAR202 cluster bacterium Casp-Chloro-G3]